MYRKPKKKLKIKLKIKSEILQRRLEIEKEKSETTQKKLDFVLEQQNQKIKESDRLKTEFYEKKA